MNYFRWFDSREKNNCFLCSLRGQKKEGELRRGEPLAAQRKKPYLYAMDDEYPRNIKLTDHLLNDAYVIVASPRLRDLLVERLGKAIEVLPVHIEDHKKRIASKDYSIINLLDRQECLAVQESLPSYSTIDGREVLTGVQRLTIDPGGSHPTASCSASRSSTSQSWRGKIWSRRSRPRSSWA